MLLVKIHYHLLPLCVVVKKLNLLIYDIVDWVISTFMT